ncbi:hypothetical protein CYMTET_34260, partial [Cymbomonas tetramitiformis]
DWAFWIFAENLKGIRPQYIRQDLFRYRIRANSMHQSLLSNQEYSLASVRILHPTLYPVELLLAAHDKLLNANELVRTKVDEKLAKHPSHATPHLMRGLLSEAQGSHLADGHEHGYYWEDALSYYRQAAALCPHHDWQPRWRIGLLLQRMERFQESNRTFADLFRHFSGLDEAYKTLNQELLSLIVQVRRVLDSILCVTFMIKREATFADSVLSSQLIWLRLICQRCRWSNGLV